MKCGGLHCGGCSSHGGGGVGLAVIVVVIIAIGVKVAQALARTAHEAAHVFGDVVTWTEVVLAVTASAAAAAGLSWAGYRVYHWQVSRRRSAPLRVVQVRTPPNLPVAVEAPKLRPSGIDDLVREEARHAD